MAADRKRSAMKVNEGIPQPPSVNPGFSGKGRRKGKKLLDTKSYVDGILGGDRYLLSQAITLVESAAPRHHQKAQEVIEQCLPYSGHSIRVGITGVPGVGKSTFIESLGSYLTAKGHKLAVLAIDPSSSRSKGSILGDKTRMEQLSSDDKAFIRPSPSAGSLGGVARKTRESIILAEAAGYDVIFVETVGVGQSETTVHAMVDFFLLLMLAGAGDELQGIKRGIMEMADTLIINKADGNNKDNALRASREYKNALHLFPPPESGWETKVDTCSAQTGEGIEKVWKYIMDYQSFTQKSGYFNQRRNQQAKLVMYDAINQRLKDNFYQNKQIKEKLPEIEEALLASKVSPYNAARKLLEDYYGSGEIFQSGY